MVGPNVFRYTKFAPALEKLICLRKEQANQLSEPRSCWETLAQPFEPDLTIKRLNELFAPLREQLPDLVHKAKTFSYIVRSVNFYSFELKEENENFI